MSINSHCALFICCTPFQLWLTQHIIKQEKFQEYTVICLKRKEDNAQKFHYYYDQLAYKSADSLLVDNAIDFELAMPLANISLRGLWKFRAKVTHAKNIFRHLHGKSFKYVYLANYEKWLIGVLCSQIRFQQLYSFDDGSRNFLPNHDIPSISASFIEKYKTWKAKRLLSLKYTPHDLYTKIIQHYTINASLPNAVNKPLVQLTLPAFSYPRVSSQAQQKIKVFVGQPGEAHRIPNKLYSTIEEHICVLLSINHYFPHPRSMSTTQYINTINTPLIFEDWVAQQINQHPNHIFEIYTLFSSVVLTIPQSNNIHITALDIGIFPELYDIFKRKGVTVKEFKAPFNSLLTEIASSYQTHRGTTLTHH